MDAITTFFSTHKKNVEEYYNIMLHKQFSIIEIYLVKIETKFATNIKHFELWLNDKYFNHINKIVIGALIMFIKNINISKGTVIGAIIIITSIIYDLQNNVITIKVQLIY
jgi:hypothetical protein